MANHSIIFHLLILLSQFTSNNNKVPYEISAIVRFQIQIVVMDYYLYHVLLQIGDFLVASHYNPSADFVLILCMGEKFRFFLGGHCAELLNDKAL